MKYFKINNNENKYPNASTLKESFLFLNDFDFKIIREESLSYGSYLEYKGNGLKIYLGFDFKDYRFSFDLYKKNDLKYSDIAYGISIIPFSDLATEIKTNYHCSELQPCKEKGYEDALKCNVILLKEYLDRNLKPLTRYDKTSR